MIADCGLRIADCGFMNPFILGLESEIESFINLQSAIRNPQSAILITTESSPYTTRYYRGRSHR